MNVLKKLNITNMSQMALTIVSSPKGIPPYEKPSLFLVQILLKLFVCVFTQSFYHRQWVVLFCVFPSAPCLRDPSILGRPGLPHSLCTV